MALVTETLHCFIKANITKFGEKAAIHGYIRLLFLTFVEALMEDWRVVKWVASWNKVFIIIINMIIIIIVIIIIINMLSFWHSLIDSYLGFFSFDNKVLFTL